MEDQQEGTVDPPTRSHRGETTEGEDQGHGKSQP